MICISQDTRLKQKVRSPSFGILKQTLWSQSNASQILFIDPKSNWSTPTHFRIIAEGSLGMNLSLGRENLKNITKYI